MDGSLFVWTCPSCSQANLARYETLYHDPEKQLMIWHLPTGDWPEAEMQAVTRHASAMGRYTLRRVSSVTDLMEKVMLAEAGLDDVAMEMCKYVTRLELAAKAGEERAAEMMALPMHFFRKDERDGQEFITLSFPDNGRMTGMNIGMNVYDDCMGILQRNPSVIPTEGFIKIDSDWVLSIF